MDKLLTDQHNDRYNLPFSGLNRELFVTSKQYLPPMTESVVENRPALVVDEERLPPVRGLVPLQNRKGKPFSAIDIKRWLRLQRLAFGCEKVDLLANAKTVSSVSAILSDAGEMGMRVSLRVDGSFPPPDISGLKADGLLDVMLTPCGHHAAHLDAWMGACSEAAIPFRLQIQGPLDATFDTDAYVEQLLTSVPVVVNIAAFDPFVTKSVARNSAQSKETVAKMNALAKVLASHGIEVNLLRLPFCIVDRDLWNHVVNGAQFYRDHQQYERESYELAETLYRFSPSKVSTLVLILLSRNSFERTLADAVILRLFLNARFGRDALNGIHKLTNHWRRMRGRAEERVSTLEEHDRAVARQKQRDERTLGAELANCSMRRVSDGKSSELDQALPGLKMTPLNGELIVSPMHYARHQHKYYDAIDEARRPWGEGYEVLEKKANEIVENLPADRQLMPYEYEIENAPFDVLEGGVRWHSISTREKYSNPLAALEPPFTLSVSFGGGIAEYIGFSFGRHNKVLCAMEEYRHKLVLHVEADGHYVLLRDGVRVRPVEFRGEVYAPLRLGGLLEPRISCWNIDGKIVTQFIKFWYDTKQDDAQRDTVKYSVVVVNSRYTRRLQATLQCLAHQQDFDLNQLEVIVCYVPGQDATDDLIDSMHRAYPGLRIVRAPFRERKTNAKGYMINEAVRMAAGEWVCLMDADILLAPDMFARIDEAAQDSDFIAPDGRVMLTEETTAQILLGERKPWVDWDALVEGAGEYRYREAIGVPVGFLQVFRKTFMDDVKYAELDHFEGADMWFGMELQKRYGKETRLMGRPVLHLDHGGSQWYGTQKHW
jgi:hypothetical protein